MEKTDKQLLAISVMFSAATALAWVTVTGPPNLRDWQTLIAACVALLGGALAYKGAMAKVALDREAAMFALQRERISLYLKLAYAIDLLGNEVKRQRTWMEVPFRDWNAQPFALPPERTIEAKDFSFAISGEFEEAWNKLDIFDNEDIVAMANIRSTLRTVAGSVGVWGATHTWTYNRIQMPEELKRFAVILTDLEGFCEKLACSLFRKTKTRVPH
jgi:hypothetical protein